MATEIRCGQFVGDTLSGLEGVVVARTEWLYGCVRLAVQPSGSKDGKPYEPFWVDEPQVVVRDTKEVGKEDAETGAAPARRHGPKDAPTRAVDPKSPQPSEVEMW